MLRKCSPHAQKSKCAPKMGNQGIILKGDYNDKHTSQSSSPEELPPIFFSMV
jgi:hypothetical protein